MITFKTKWVYMNATKKYLILSGMWIGLSLPLCTFMNPVYAQDSTTPQIAGQATSLSGLFSIRYGDRKDGGSIMIYTLTDANGRRTELQLDKAVSRKLGGVLQFNGKHVTVQGTWITPSHVYAIPGLTQGLPTVLNVISISLAPPSESKAPAIKFVAPWPSVSGSKPWVTIMCKFSDIADEPNDRAYFLGMYGDNRPGLNHYWKELSFNTLDVTGSTVGTGWYTLPETELHYNPTNTKEGTNLNALATDCIDAADADVDFSLYDGINMMFNSDFDDGIAWGGGLPATLDGVTKNWSITWEPPWAYADISVIAHEMGHGFGLPHSTANQRDINNTPPVYDNVWDVLSDDSDNCNPGSVFRDATYGCMAQHTISYHKDLMGWIPKSRKTTVLPGTSSTVILEDLAAPASNNYQMVKIPLNTSATNFYTVEARRRFTTSYDAKLPDEAVIIHNVDMAEDIPALLVPSGLSAKDQGVIWTVGETFTDATNNIAVKVNSNTGNGFKVTISSLPPVSLTVNPPALNLTSTPSNCGDNQEIEVTTTGLMNFYVALASGNKFKICIGQKPCTGPWSESFSNVPIGSNNLIGSNGFTYITVGYIGNLSNDSDTIIFKDREDNPATLATVNVSGTGLCSDVFKPPLYDCPRCSILEDPWSWLTNPMVLLSLGVLPFLAWAMGRNFGAAYQTNRGRMIVAATGFAVIAVGATIGAWIVIGATALVGGAVVLRQTTNGQG